MPTAKLYRMVTPEHVCPWGLKSRGLLQRKGYEVEDHPLRSRAETEAFMAEHGVDTTPQTWIDGIRVGGYDDLARRFDVPKIAFGGRYQPVIAIFAMSFLIALAISGVALGTVWDGRVIGWFIATAMCLLAVQKLQDLESFSTMFLGYDLLAQKEPRYAYVYPFAEGLAGVLMIAGVLIWIAAPVAVVIGGIGAVSVAKAVWIDRRELKCACVGGNSDVPLGFVSFTENAMMLAMGVWMLLA